MNNFHCILIKARNQSGQALVTLLFFTMIGIAIIAASIAILYANTQSTSTNEQGQMSFYLAESGVEDGILQLLRDPTKRTSYGPYNPVTGSTQISVTITNGLITATGTSGNTARIIKAQTVYNADGTFTISSWQESSTP